ncbi:MAG: hypothetical protein GVY20_04830 [Bacteroidetes bacterium]|nr:hypothetical protein [Bacteroidota bacterium]
MKKTFNVRMLSSLLVVFCLFFLGIANTIAQNNTWQSSAPNPPSGLTTDASGLVANGAKDFDFDRFEREVDQEMTEVNNNTNYSPEEKKVRIKVLDDAMVRASEGFAIEPAFDLVYNKYNPLVENKAPSVDLGAIIDEYKDKFEQ